MKNDSIHNPLERSKEEDYYGILYKDLDIKAFLEKPIHEKRRTAAELEIPDVAGSSNPTEKPGAPMPAPTDGAAAKPPMAPSPALQPPPMQPKPDPRVDKLLQEIEQLKVQLVEINNLGGIEGIRKVFMEDLEKVKNDLSSKLEKLEDRKTPERGTFDTEGAYRDHLYSMAVRLLDEVLPELFAEIPDYSFIASQVSRVYEDGTVADGMVTVNVIVPKEGMKYEFKVDVPILNGLLHAPMYLERGQKIVPLTKQEIQRELDSISYRKVDVDDIYMKKDNIFNNIGENIHRQPDKQKWYEVKKNEYKQVGMPPDPKWNVQRGI